MVQNLDPFGQNFASKRFVLDFGFFISLFGGLYTHTVVFSDDIYSFWFFFYGDDQNSLVFGRNDSVEYGILYNGLNQ